ncbi:MAG: fructose-bisphosphatase class II [Planctomycetota bacterium JB042]
MVGHGDDWRLDFVVSPIDGVRDLLEGRDSGSVSIVSGGPAGVFEPSHPDLREGQIGHANRYLLTVVPPHRGGVDDPEGLVKEIGRDLPSEAYAPREFLSRSAILSRVRSLVEGTKAPAEMTVATILPTRPAKKGENRDLTPIIGDVARTRSHCGSSVMAAIQTFYSTLGVDAYLGVVRRTHAVLIAASSHSMRGGFVAFPIDESGKVIARPFTAADFLTTTIADAPVDLFVAATGISETLVLEGVRFRDRSSVATHTLCLRSRTRSSRLIKHQHDLDRKRFHMLDRRSTKTLSFESVLDSLEKYVRTNA